MDLKFRYLSTAVSLMSEEHFQKVLAIRQPQIEKTRISEYVAGSEKMQLKSAADKIKIVSALSRRHGTGKKPSATMRGAPFTTFAHGNMRFCLRNFL
jgi:hypothetical protein